MNYTYTVQTTTLYQGGHARDPGYRWAVVHDANGRAFGFHCDPEGDRVRDIGTRQAGSKGAFRKLSKKSADARVDGLEAAIKAYLAAPRPLAGLELKVGFGPSIVETETAAVLNVVEAKSALAVQLELAVKELTARLNRTGESEHVMAWSTGLCVGIHNGKPTVMRVDRATECDELPRGATFRNGLGELAVREHRRTLLKAMIKKHEGLLEQLIASAL